jgi:hypothetical protein
MTTPSVRRDLPGPRRRAALALPYADTDMMQLHLDEISRNVAEGAHAVLLLDRAGWHTTSKLDVPGNRCSRAKATTNCARWSAGT